ncbi:MAG: HAMP domain-containing histidine kinase, partial [Gammaproteobacteria bacterium]|nr:HAMP domain-containing histidine kinase [Gammaproteobacteria bacterium]
LSAALLYTSNASRPELSAERRTEILDKATHCLTDLEQLIGDMLQFARGAGRTKDFVSLEELMSSIDVSLRPALKSGQSMKIDLPESAIQMSGNREALTGAVLNLANNALQAAGDQAQVEITGRPDGAFVEICVADNGPGIAPEKVGKIFDPFYTSRPDGTGLGLAVVKSVTESHGGEVYVDETTPRGTKFVMRLPVAEAAADDIEGEHETIAEGAAA